jgi:dynein heavy chain
MKNKYNVLAVGTTGTGKTALLNGILQELDDSYSYFNIVFSAQTGAQKA